MTRPTVALPLMVCLAAPLAVNAFWLTDGLTERVEIMVRDGQNGAITLLPADRGGQVREEWNAAVAGA